MTENWATHMVFVTSNKGKVTVLRKALEPFGIKVVQKKLKTPEIQELGVSKVAEFSAKFAAYQVC